MDGNRRRHGNDDSELDIVSPHNDSSGYADNFIHDYYAPFRSPAKPVLHNVDDDAVVNHEFNSYGDNERAIHEFHIN